MLIKRSFLEQVFAVVFMISCFGIAAAADNPEPPAEAVKLIFIHHSTGGNWLGDVDEWEQFDGGLGEALMANNYYVSATNYGWTVNSDDIGSRTDIGQWWDWFRGPNRDEIMNALFHESDQNIGDFLPWTRMAADPGGENQIIMFKSCYPNSHISGSPNDPPTTSNNPMRGANNDLGWGGSRYTVGNAKGIYNDILEYFATRTDKLWVLITPPPIAADDMYHSDEHTATHAANARALNNWLVNDWLDGYPHNNVAVFDFFNVLTSNGGDVFTNDADASGGNHHRWDGSSIEHVTNIDNNFSSYGAYLDSHPTDAGGQKATSEFLPLLNIFYNRFMGGGSPPPATSGPDVSLPAVAKAPGSNNAYFYTRAEVFNAGASTMSVKVTYTPRGGTCTGARTAMLSLPARIQQSVLNPLAEWFGLPAESGDVGSLMFEVQDNADATNLLVQGVVFSHNSADGGEYGQFFPAVPTAEAVQEGNSVYLDTTVDAERFRVNLGVMAVANNTTVKVTPVGPMHTTLANPKTTTLDTGANIQYNDVHDKFNLDPGLENFLFRVEVTSGAAIPFVSVIDGKGEAGYTGTNDPTTINPLDPASHICLLELGSIEGSADYSGSASITNFDTSLTTVEAIFIPRTDMGSSPSFSTITIEAGDTNGYGDLVAEVFGVTQVVGTVILAAQGGAEIAATGREFSYIQAHGEVDGTAGQLVAGMTEDDIIRPGHTYHLLGLRHYEPGGGVSERSHFAVYNPGGTPIYVTLRLFDGANGSYEGEYLDPATQQRLRVGGGQLKQINGIIKAINPSYDDRSKRLEVEIDGDAFVNAFRVNMSDDPITIDPLVEP